MRVSLATLAFLLTLAVLHSEANEAPSNQLITCCFSYMSMAIPLSRVENYPRTSAPARGQVSTAPQQWKGFQTRHGRLICANPGQAWVQRYIIYLNQKSKGAGSSGTFTVEGS
ncbi:regakine-1-like [Muntiacus reevesi]|uniref:regakine-1-like n=1 Tax=Muntiacus reevesi TaxID=9886 RepID=UPI0033073217